MHRFAQLVEAVAPGRPLDRETARSLARELRRAGALARATRALASRDRSRRALEQRLDEVELGRADEDEILDPEPAQHGLDATPRSVPRRPARTAESPAPRPSGPRAPQGGWGVRDGTGPALRRCHGSVPTG